LATYSDRFDELRRRFSERDRRMGMISEARNGNLARVYPTLFPEGMWDQPIIANMIDVVAKDLSEQIGVLPTISASGDSALDESQRTKADKRTKIANYYMSASRLSSTIIKAADQLITFGFVPLRVEPNFKEGRPHIGVDFSIGSYWNEDRFGDLTVFANLYHRKAGEIAAHFPEARDRIMRDHRDQNSMMKVIRWTTEDEIVMFTDEDVILARQPNPLGRIPVALVKRPTFDGQTSGQFDDVLPVYAAKARLALLMLEATQKSVEAPLALPQDVTQLNVGPDSVIRSNNPEKIRRVALDVPQYSFAENNILSEELKYGTRFPESRAGQADGSVVTGQGVKALQAAFDQQVKVAQAILGEGLGEAISLSMATDEAYFGDIPKQVSGKVNGVPYALKYTPNKDINGNYGVNIEYGLMAGLDPNRALVFALQARGDKLISRSFTRRHLPIQINPAEEERAVDMEEIRDSLKAGVSSLAAAIPQMVTQGQDPVKIVTALAEVIDARKKGTPIEDAVQEAFAPEPPPEQQQAAPEPEPLPMSPSRTASPTDQAMEQGGVDNEAMPTPPPMQNLLAGLTGTGKPTMSGYVRRSIPA
jgi:hypothetical protein